MRPKLARSVHRPDGRYRALIATVYFIFRPPLSQNPPSAPDVRSQKRVSGNIVGNSESLLSCLLSCYECLVVLRNEVKF